MGGCGWNWKPPRVRMGREGESNMQKARAFTIAAAAAMLLGACAPAAEQARTTMSTRGKTTLVVENANWSDITIYLLYGSSRIRMGSVPSMRQARFNIPDAYVLGVSDVTLQADPVGSGRTWISPPIQVFPGAQVALKVENAIRLSNFAVYVAN